MKKAKKIKWIAISAVMMISVIASLCYYFYTNQSDFLAGILQNKEQKSDEKTQAFMGTSYPVETEDENGNVKTDWIISPDGTDELANISATVTAVEGRSTISTQSEYPIMPDSEVKFTITITNKSIAKTAKGLQIVTETDEINYDDTNDTKERTEQTDEFELKPKGNYTYEFTVPIKKEYFRIYLKGNNISKENNTTNYYQLASYKFEILKDILNNEQKASLINIEHNLPENPEGIVYEKDTLKGEIVAYTNVGIGTDELYYNRENYNEVYIKYTSLTISIPVPDGIEIDTNSLASNVKIEETDEYPKKKNIVATIDYLRENERYSLTFNYTISKGCEEFELKATGKLYSMWKDKRGFNDDGEEIKNSTYKWSGITGSDLKETETISYKVSRPNIKVECSVEQNAKERQEFTYKFIVRNEGGIAVNVQIEQAIAEDVAVQRVLCTNGYGDTVKIGSNVYNGNVNINIGRIKQGEEIIIRVIVTSRILASIEDELTIDSQATIFDKTQSITTDKMKVKIQKDDGLHLNVRVRDRLADSYKNCPEKINLEQKTEIASYVWYLHTLDGREIYCIQPNKIAYGKEAVGQLSGFDTYNTYETVRGYVNSYGTGYGHCGHATPPEYLRSATVFKCKNEHYLECSPYTNPYSGESVENLYDVGFIASWRAKWTVEQKDGWSTEKQQALWQSILLRQANAFEAANSGNQYQGKRVLDIATKYKDFWEKIIDKKDEEGKEDDKNYGIKPESLYEYETIEDNNQVDNSKVDKNKEIKRMEIDVNQETQKYTIGPFKLDYINGTYKTDGITYSFGGISDMYLLDEKNNRINICNFIKVEKQDDGTEETKVYKVKYPEEKEVKNLKQFEEYEHISVVQDSQLKQGETTFFSTFDFEYENGQKGEMIKSDGNKMDWNAKSKNYPKPGEEFYIEVEINQDYNKDGKIDANDCIPAALKLKTEFQYMYSTASICLREGSYYEVGSKEDDPTHWHYCNCDEPCDHEPTECFDCYIYTWVEENENQQDTALILDHNRQILQEELIIPIDSYITTTMKIGGFVFQDQLNGKETVANGIKDDSDIPLANVEVALYDAATNELVKLKPLEGDDILEGLNTLKNERPEIKDENGNPIFGATTEEVNDPDDYKRRINPTLTDKNGYYEFRGVPIGKQYYVKFTYNGQTYTPTDYMKAIEEKQDPTDPNEKISQEKKVEIDRLNDTSLASFNVGAEGNTNYGNSSEWQQASKGTEKDSERENFDNRFASIGSSPNNYATSNSLGLDTKNILSNADGKVYNETYTEYELAGLTLQADGKYTYDSKKQLVDSYYTISKKSTESEAGFIINNSASRDAFDKFVARKRL